MSARFARMKTTPQPEQPSSSASFKRRLEEDDEDNFEQGAKAKRCEPLRNITLDYSLCDENNIKELFDDIRLIGFDAPRGEIRGHWHVLGIPKCTKRYKH